MTESQRCTYCKSLKPDDHYRMCENCRRDKREEYRKYRAHKESARYAWMIELKESTPCTDCGSYRSHRHMHWDHLPGFEKVASISDMIKQNLDRSEIDAELTKCELVCDRCHHRRGRERGQHHVPQKGGQEFPCEVCGTLTYRTPSITWKHIYCSRECMALGNRTANLLPISFWEPPKKPQPYSQTTIRRAQAFGNTLPDGSDPNDPNNPRVPR